MCNTRWFNRLVAPGLLLILVLAALTIVMVPPATAGNTGNEEGEVEPAVGRPGTVFAFYATGFSDTETVAYWFNTPDGSVIADDRAYRIRAVNGRSDWNWKAPMDAIPGTWAVVVQGTSSGAQQIISFTIENPYEAQPDTPLIGGAITNAPGVGVEPPSAILGTRFTFYADGFWGKEPVAFWATDPRGDGHAGDHGHWVRANEQGRADWHWTPQPGDMYGIWIMVAHGLQSDHEQVIYFEVLEPGAPSPTSETSNRPLIAVEPAYGPPGTEFRFYALGFSWAEEVEYVPFDPDGGAYHHERYIIEANLNGRADWVWRSPSNATPGIWKMVVTGHTTGIQRVILFEVRYSEPIQLPIGR